MRVPRLELFFLLAAGLMAVGAIAIPAHADDPVDKLYTVEQSAAQSRAERDALAKTAASLAAEIEGLRWQSVSAAEALQHHEAALSMLEAQLKTLGDEANSKAAELRQDESERGGLLMALVKLARNPPEALALASPDPVTAERSALLLGNAVPPIDRAAHRLATDLKQLASLRAAIAQARERHRAEQAQLSTQQGRLSDLIARKSELQRQAQIGAQANEERLAALAAEAANLKDLIERLDRERLRVAAAVNSTRLAMTNVAARIAAAAAPAEPAPPSDAKPKAQQVAAPATAPAAPSDPWKPAKLRSFLYAPGNYLVPASGKLI